MGHGPVLPTMAHPHHFAACKALQSIWRSPRTSREGGCLQGEHSHGPTGEVVLPGEAEEDISGSALGEDFNAFRQLGHGSASQPRGGGCGEAQSRALALLSCSRGVGLDSRGCASAGGPQPAREASIKPSTLHPVSSSLETPPSLHWRRGGCWRGGGTHWPKGSHGQWREWVMSKHIQWRGGAPWREERHCTPLNAAVPSHKRLTRLLHPHS